MLDRVLQTATVAIGPEPKQRADCRGTRRPPRYSAAMRVQPLGVSCSCGWKRVL